MVDIRKNSVEVIRIELSEFKGRSYVNVRLWVGGDRQGELIPTQKGVASRPEQLPEVIAALQDITEAESV